ncbi:hypothetical protein ACVWY3_004812 [Bradyrhizobium sp. USDA 4486]
MRYFHVVFTVPPPVAANALKNKAVVYDILLQAAASGSSAPNRSISVPSPGVIVIFHIRARL